MTILLSILVMTFACLYSPASSAGPLNGLPGKDGIRDSVSGNSTLPESGSTVTAAALDVGSVTDTTLIPHTYAQRDVFGNYKVDEYFLTVPTSSPKSFTLGEFRKIESGTTLELQPFIPVSETVVFDTGKRESKHYDHPFGMAVVCTSDAGPAVSAGGSFVERRYFNLYRSESAATHPIYWLVFTGDVHDASQNKATLKCGSSSIQVLAKAPVLEAAAIDVDSVTDTTLISTTYSYPGTTHNEEIEVYTLTVPTSVPKSYTLGEFKPVENGETLKLEPFARFLYEGIFMDHDPAHDLQPWSYGNEIDYPFGMAVKCPSDVPPTLSTDDDFGRRRYFNLYRSEAASVPSLYWLVFTGDVNDSSQNKVTLQCGGQSIPVIAEGDWKD